MSVRDTPASDERSGGAYPPDTEVPSEGDVAEELPGVPDEDRPTEEREQEDDE